MRKSLPHQSFPSFFLSFPSKRESRNTKKILDARLRGHDGMGQKIGGCPQLKPIKKWKPSR